MPCKQTCMGSILLGPLNILSSGYTCMFQGEGGKGGKEGWGTEKDERGGEREGRKSEEGGKEGRKSEEGEGGKEE